MLCHRVGQGDDGAFDLLVERYRARAYRLAWSILRDPDEASDLSQEAFIRLYERARSFNGQARFSTWFYRVVTNLCLDHRRRHHWWRRLFAAGGQGASAAKDVDNHPAPAPDPDDEIDREEARRRLWQEVERLPARQRAALVLHVHEELPTGEIAAVLGCSESTVRVHLHRALETLRRRMENNGG